MLHINSARRSIWAIRIVRHFAWLRPDQHSHAGKENHRARRQPTKLDGRKTSHVRHAA
jgi:hypothetical protein